MRILILSVLATLIQVGLFSAEAQRVSNEQIVSELSALRTNNASLGAQITGLESDKAALNGKVETLEFLLSQSRDQINAMQGDDAEIGRLIARLERRLASQAATIRTLETKLAELDERTRPPEPVMAEEAVTQSQPATGSSQTAQTPSRPTRIVSTASPTQLGINNQATAPVTTTGPTRITRRTIVNGQTVSEVTTTQSAQTPAPNTTTSLAGGNQAPQPQNEAEAAQSLPQGSLGTLPASALPGDAGPLFAEAKSRLLQFDYAGAEDAFRAFLTQFSDDPQAGEAQYWLAEVLYQQEAYPESGQAYTTMIRAYPDDPRAPEALAKLARSMRLVGDLDQACAALDLLPTRYPNASGVTRNLAAGERVRAGCDS